MDKQPTTPCGKCDGTILWERCAESGCQAAPTPTAAEQAAQIVLACSGKHWRETLDNRDWYTMIAEALAAEQSARQAADAELERAKARLSAITGILEMKGNSYVWDMIAEWLDDATADEVQRAKDDRLKSLLRESLLASARAAEAEVARLRERIKELEAGK